MSTRRSVAFKCTYNDGDAGLLVGFAGTCSLDNISRNVHDSRVWCSNKKCQCRKFYDKGMKGSLPVEPCQESKLFTQWKYGAGSFHGAAKHGLIPLKRSGPGKFAILTTRFPDEPESARHIVGLFQIDRIEKQNTLFALEKGRIRLPMEEAKELFFWAYCSNASRKPDWRTGLFRYLDDGQVHRILQDVAATVRDESAKSEINYLISQSFGVVDAPPAAGCLPEKSVHRADAITYLRKYGVGGEGKEHKKLKEWILKHPEILGLTDVKCGWPEYRFLSGDAVDIVFEHKSGAYTVIEIETTVPMPGAHQAVKYRALMCAQKGLPLNSGKVQAFLVAWKIPADVEQFCKRYGILFSEQMAGVQKVKSASA